MQVECRSDVFVLVQPKSAKFQWPDDFRVTRPAFLSIAQYVLAKNQDRYKFRTYGRYGGHEAAEEEAYPRLDLHIVAPKVARTKVAESRAKSRRLRNKQE
jgi:hypothetical protein